jgi:hypothetical protein
MSNIPFVKIPPSFIKGRGLGGWIEILPGGEAKIIMGFKSSSKSKTVA